jgi:hypothetical protein
MCLTEGSLADTVRIQPPVVPEAHGLMSVQIRRGHQTWRTVNYALVGHLNLGRRAVLVTAAAALSGSETWPKRSR